MGCLAPDEVTYLKCLPVEKKIEPDVQVTNKKKRKVVLEEEITIDEPKSERKATELVFGTKSD